MKGAAQGDPQLSKHAYVIMYIQLLLGLLTVLSGLQPFPPTKTCCRTPQARTLTLLARALAQ